MPWNSTSSLVCCPAKPLNVVVADDVPELRQLVGLWLGEQGHTISYAATAAEAIELASDPRCELLCTDLLMPDGDGLDVITQIGERNPEIKILAFSGDRWLDTPSGRRLGELVGEDHVLAKPFNRAQLFDAIQRVTG